MFLSACQRVSMQVGVYVCVCVQVCNGCATAVSFWAVYVSQAVSSSCSSASHMTARAAVIGLGRGAGEEGVQGWLARGRVQPLQSYRGGVMSSVRRKQSITNNNY